MTPRRVNLLLLGLVGVLFLALIGSAYGVSSLLKTKALALSEDKLQAQVVSSQQTGLTRAKREIDQYSQLEQITKTIVPQDKDQAEAVRELNNIAAANNVALNTITFAASDLGAGAVPTGAPAAAVPTHAVPVTTKSLSQLVPVANIPGVYDLQITVGNNQNNSVTFAQLDAFLRGLENNRRTAAVSSLNIQPQSNDPDKLVFTMILNDYIKPS